MNHLDIAIMLVFIASAFTSYFQGFIREMLSVLAWLSALLVMLIYWVELDRWLEVLLPGSLSRTLLAGLMLFLSTLLLVTLINTLIVESMRYQQISVFERIFGILFGVVRSSLFVILYCTLAGFTQLPHTIGWQQSMLLPVFMQVSNILQNQFAPDIGINF